LKYLLDSAVFLWSLNQFERLNKEAAQILEGGEELFLSAASSWEIVIKVAIGKLNLSKPPAQLIPDAMTRLAIQGLPITHAHSLAVSELPDHHKDPFDRLLIAQARSEGMAFMTADHVCSQYPVKVAWCGR
jgi:PIN domain nuclease of toxin-antitoxin system